MSEGVQIVASKTYETRAGKRDGLGRSDAADSTVREKERTTRGLYDRDGEAEDFVDKWRLSLCGPPKNRSYPLIGRRP
jgi:hypothetical protein